MSRKINREALRESGRITAAALTATAEAVGPGITTAELDAIAEQVIRQEGGTPAFMGYQGFPATLCTSVNHEVVHGIPGPYALSDGDIVSLDAGVKVDGWYTDSAVTVPVGDIEAEIQQLLEITWKSLYVGIKQIKAGHTVGDYGHAVQELAETNGLGVVRDCVGHGIGQKLHLDPSIPNFGSPHQGATFEAGMVVAVEPMLVTGNWEVQTAADHWTVVTRDHSVAAHYEETVIVTERGIERLTPLPDVLQARNPGARLGKVTPRGSARSFAEDTHG